MKTTNCESPVRVKFVWNNFSTQPRTIDNKIEKHKSARDN